LVGYNRLVEGSHCVYRGFDSNLLFTSSFNPPNRDRCTRNKEAEVVGGGGGSEEQEAGGQDEEPVEEKQKFRHIEQTTITSETEKVELIDRNVNSETHKKKTKVK